MYNIGYHYFWQRVLQELEVSQPQNLMNYFVMKDKEKMGKFYKTHTTAAKRFRQKEKNKKQAIHVQKALNDA